MSKLDVSETQTDTSRLKDVKAVIAYLAEKFPNCFSVEGTAKPLKIGLFQELAQRLAEDNKVSKTQLRQALRRYTNSWRYLRCQVAGAQRVDLEGNPCGELEQEHIDHAQKALNDSQEKAKAIRKERQQTKEKDKSSPVNKEKTNPHSVASVTEKRLKTAKIKSNPQAKPKAKRNSKPLKAVSPTDLKLNQRVLVKLGKSPIKGTVTDINRDDITVSLESGLTIKVKAEHIRV